MQRTRMQIAGILVVWVSTTGWAAPRSRFDAFFAPGDTAQYSVQAEPGHDGAPSVLDQRASGSVEVARRSSDTWSLNGRASRFDLSRPVPIPLTPLIFPDVLYNVSGGGSYLHETGDRRQWGMNTSVGSASDTLFHSIHETEFQATGSAMIPSGAHNAWLFLLNYSNNRTFLNNIPLPGFAYIWNAPKKHFRAVVGFPFLLLTWRPNDAWSGRLSLTGTTNQSLEVSRRLRGTLRAFVAYERSPLQWMRAGREDNATRLVYDEKKVLLGLRRPLGHGLSLDLSGGRTFDRRMFEDRDAAQNDAPRATLANGWITALTLSARWGRSDREN